MRMRIEGGELLDRALKVAGRDARRHMGFALFAEGNRIMEDSKQVVPVDTGTLRNSGTVMPPQVSGGGVSVELGYGGLARDYALVIHEAPREWNWSKPGTGPKYLERPVLAAARGLPRRLAGLIRGRILRSR